jgi:hypothetical protein
MQDQVDQISISKDLYDSESDPEIGSDNGFGPDPRPPNMVDLFDDYISPPRGNLPVEPESPPETPNQAANPSRQSKNLTTGNMYCSFPAQQPLLDNKTHH